MLIEDGIVCLYIGHSVELLRLGSLNTYMLLVMSFALTNQPTVVTVLRCLDRVVRYASRADLARPLGLLCSVTLSFLLYLTLVDSINRVQENYW